MRESIAICDMCGRGSDPNVIHIYPIRSILISEPDGHKDGNHVIDLCDDCLNNTVTIQLTLCNDILDAYVVDAVVDQ